MIFIKSYLCNSKGEDFVEVTRNLAYEITDPRYVTGAIELKIDGVAVIDRGMWDLVDQLWAYITQMIVDLRRSGEAQTYFPDQAIKLAFEKVSTDMIRVSAYPNKGPITVITGENQLIAALKEAGQHFFVAMRRLNPAHDEIYASLIQQLEQA